MGILIGTVSHFDYVKRGQMGRDEFLAKQSTRYDKFFAKPSPMAVDLVAGTIAAAGIYGTYELIAFGLAFALRKLNNDLI